jgi:hypothetical protein
MVANTTPSTAERSANTSVKSEISEELGAVRPPASEPVRRRIVLSQHCQRKTTT